MAVNSSDIQQRIKLFRKLRGMTQEELSLASGINFGLIRKYECGERVPKLDQLQSISSALGISLDTLMDFDIRTFGDVMGFIVKLDDIGCIKLSGKKKKDGTYVPSSISLSFDNDDLLNVIADYMQYRDNCTSDTDVILEGKDDSLRIQIEKTRFMMDDSPL